MSLSSLLLLLIMPAGAIALASFAVWNLRREERLEQRRHPGE